MKWMLAIFMFQLTGCTNLFYQPTRLAYFNPGESSAVAPKDIFFTTSDGIKLHGWYFETKVAKPKGLVVQFHGNAENLTSHFLSLAWVLQHGYNLFTFDYRGYGKSEGSPFPQGVYLDSLAAMDQASQLTQGAKGALVVYGQSLGGAVALRALADYTHHEAIRAAVIESAFLSYKRIAKDKLSEHWQTWLLQWLGYVLVTNKYSAKKKMDFISPIPLLVLHGSKDPVVPFHHGEEIFKRAHDPKCFLRMESASHINLTNIDGGKIRRQILDFFDSQKCPVQE